MISYSSLAIATTSAVIVSGTLAIHSSQAQEPMLTDTVWELQQIQYNNDTLLVPESPENYTIQFFEDGTVGIRADCNVGTGTYDTESADFITLGASTLAACPPDSIDDEFRSGLEDAVIYFFQDGNLYMDLPADGGTLMFAPAAETPTAEEETEIVVEEEPEMVEESVTEEATAAPETTTEAEPVRGLW